jgi:hypothetical protein
MIQTTSLYDANQPDMDDAMTSLYCARDYALSLADVIPTHRQSALAELLDHLDAAGMSIMRCEGRALAAAATEEGGAEIMEFPKPRGDR